MPIASSAPANSAAPRWHADRRSISGCRLFRAGPPPPSSRSIWNGRLPPRCAISSRASCRAPSRSRRSSAITNTSGTTSSAPRFTASCGHSRCRSRCWCAPRSTSRPAKWILRTSAGRGSPDMDPRLLHYYNQELRYLRELGGEFAEEFPKVAARLGMSGIEVADPYVERLLEGVGFLAARVQLKLDAELPRFTQSLIEIVYPHYLAPTPSMLVAQLKPELSDSNLASGVTVPRGTSLQGLLGKDDLTACEFRTAQDVTLWPLELVAASYFSYAPDLPLNSVALGPRVKGGVRLRLRTTAGLKFSDLTLDRLCVFLGGREDVANSLYELTFGAGLGALVLPPQRPPEWLEVLAASAIGRVGFADAEALLPFTHRSFQGYRLLREYLAFPQRFRFFELTGLQRALRRATTDEIDVVLLFGRGDPALESLVDAGNFALFSTPAINLFPKRLDRIPIGD